ncbi:MAG: enoyl-CoA hydratase/isomerase family protein [Acidimicrobiales bacterium]|nr:enoyl-CoA hydratase/isomerase family protein [Acidimicrobiales bacterium]
MVRYEVQAPAAILTLNRPRERNALSPELIDALLEAIERATADRQVRALVVTGAPPAFCSGMDLAELAGVLDDLRVDGRGAVWDAALRGEEVLDALYHCPKPTIAAINGVAAGNGAGLASACDMAVMADGASIGYPEMHSGIQAGMVVVHLMRLVGERAARWLLLRGELVDAPTALQIGLVNAVVPPAEVAPTALAWARQTARNGPLAEAGTKDLLCRFSGQAMALHSTAYTAAPHLTPEAREGLEAFFARRPPPWAPPAEPG